MAKIVDSDTRFQNLELKVGVMTVVAVLGVIMFIVFMGMEKGIFTRKFELDFIASTGTGFIEGMPVKLSGFVIGKVNELELTDKAEVRVTVEIDMKYQEWLTVGTKARLIKEGFIGDAVVEFVPGIYGGFNLEDGDRVEYVKVAGIEEFIGEATPVLLEIKGLIEYANDPDGDFKAAIRDIRYAADNIGGVVASIEPVVKDVEGLVGSLNDPEGNLKKTLKNLVALTEGVEKTRKELDETLAELRGAYGADGEFLVSAGEAISKASETLDEVRSIVAELEPAMEEVRSVIKNVDEFSDTLPAIGEGVEARLAEMGAAIEELRAILADIKKATPHIENLLIEAGGVVSEGLDMIEGVKTSWPVEGMVEEPERPGVIPLDAPAGVEADVEADAEAGAEDGAEDAGGGR